jgi:hypothetical protein
LAGVIRPPGFNVIDEVGLASRRELIRWAAHTSEKYRVAVSTDPVYFESIQFERLSGRRSRDRLR